LDEMIACLGENRLLVIWFRQGSQPKADV
jgi:hypothetical protein